MKQKKLLFVLCIILLLVSFLNFFDRAGLKFKHEGESRVSGFASVQAEVSVTVRGRVSNSTNYRNRIFYENGSFINISVIADGAVNDLKANFSCVDSNYAEGEENVTLLSYGTFGENYSITYTISSTTTTKNINNTEDASCPVGEECHRTCEIPITSSNGLNTSVELAFYRGNADDDYAWYVGYVTRASNCAAGVQNSRYFLEEDSCSSVYYNPGDTSYYYGAKDVDFAIKKKNTPDLVETSCTDGEDNDGDGKTDCEDADCASIVYGEYYIVGGSNLNKGYTPGWVCNRTTAGWRDDPPYGAGDLDVSLQCIDGGSCDSSCAPNLCTGTAENTDVTYIYRTAPDADWRMRLAQDSQIYGHTAYFKVWQFNSSIWQNNAGDFWILNESSDTGLTQEGATSTETSIIAQSGPMSGDPITFNNTELDIVFNALVNTTASFNGLFGLVLNRIFDGSSYNFIFNINVTDDGLVEEHNISCRDSYDNDLDYTTDCNDADCDGYRASDSTNPDGSYPVCGYGNESAYASTLNTCLDDFDNDNDGTTDCHYSSGTWDLDCNNTNILNASWDPITNVGAESGTCELGGEITCNDGFDNDRDRAYDCVTSAFFSNVTVNYTTAPDNPRSSYSGGAVPHGEYECYGDAACPATETGATCLDGEDNDLDFYQGAGDGTDDHGADCRLIEFDKDCNQTTVNNGTGSFTCELLFETSCGDGFDNDRDGRQDCDTASTGDASINPDYQFSASSHGEYDCQSACNTSGNWENTGVKCSDNIDNDLDYWTITGWTGTQYTATNNQLGGGMDCRFNYDGNHYPDSDCDGVVLPSGKECNLGSERNCTDGFDNDNDAAYNPGGNFTSSGGFDCDDYDCHADPACAATETGAQCLDNIDNDLDRYIHNTTSYLLDSDRVENTTGGGVDCIYNASGLSPDQYWPYDVAYSNYTYDLDCNNSAIGPSGQDCELINEITCDDSFDNDQDYYVSGIQSPGWTNESYNAYFGADNYSEDADCDDYSCTNDPRCPAEENYTCAYGDCPVTENWCLDGIDNDLDSYLSDGFTSNSAGGTGVDCAWNNYDTDCNNTLINDSGTVGVCTLRWEYNCTDNVDNDQNLGIYYVGDAGSATAGADTGVDCDDYNCFNITYSNGTVICTEDETGVDPIEITCNDSIDNDLDAYFWNGTGYELNSASGADCADPDCNGKIGPGGMLCALSEEMQLTPTFDDSLCADYNSSGASAFALDNDGDGPANCYDIGCYHLGECRVCPAEENITLDSCMDGLNNEYEYQNEYISTMNYAAANKNNSLDDGTTDCADTDCNGLVGQYSGSQGICNSTDAGNGYRVVESACTDGVDNDFDNNIDCEDSDCSSDAFCQTSYSNTLAACTLKCTDAGNVDYLSDEPPKYSANTDWGGGDPDLNYTQYQRRGNNITFHFTDSSANVAGETIALYLGSATATYMPLDYQVNESNSGIYGTDEGNFTLQYSAKSGDYYQAVLIEYDGAYPASQDLDITFWIQTPVTDDIVTNSSHSFYVSTVVGGIEKNADVTQYILESELPQAPVLVKTSHLHDNHTTDRLRKIKEDGNVTRLSQSDTIEIKANASDSGTWNSGIELCQFHNGTHWVNETAAYDCSYSMALPDGLNTIAVRAVDGVGNAGPNTTMTINVTTLPKQITQFYCSGGSCSTLYPARDYFIDSESMNIAVNFTSPAGFTTSGTGCTVYAETHNASTSLGTISLTASGDTGTCDGSVSLGSLSDGYYTIKAEAVDDSGREVVSGEDPWSNGNSKENIWICSYTQTYGGGYTCMDLCELEGQTEPSQVILKAPETGNITTDRTPTLQWYNSTYNNTYPPNYQIQIDDNEDFLSIEYNANGIAEGTNNETNHTVSTPLDVDKTYFWRARAYYTLVQGNWSEVWNFTVNSVIGIDLINDTVSFGSMRHEVSNDTRDNNPRPFLLENTGNIEVNLSVNATSMWEKIANPTSYYQYAIGVNETDAFNETSSTTEFTDMPLASTHSIYNLDWEDIADTAEIDINLTPPIGEISGEKNSTILVRTI